MRRTGALALGFALVLGCTPPPPTIDADAFRARWDAYSAALAAGNANAMMAYYFNDGVRIPPNDPAQRGIEAVRQHLSDFFTNYDYVLDEVTADDIQVSTDLAAVRAIYREHWSPKEGGDTTYQAGKWLSVWGLHPDGQWKIKTEMWTVEMVQ